MGRRRPRRPFERPWEWASTMGILLSDRAFAGSDSWATSYTLALAIRKLGACDVVLCGKQAIDGDTGQVGPGIARQLGLTPLTYVFRIHSLDPEGAKSS